MKPEFHLSLGVTSITASVDFFEKVLKATVTHRDPSGYVNLDFYGSQITLKESPDLNPTLPHFHFGLNLGLVAFEQLSKSILESGYEGTVTQPKVFDEGTPLERKKMYVKCPTGYLIEIKGYRQSV